MQLAGCSDSTCFREEYQALLTQGDLANPPTPPADKPRRTRTKQHPARNLLDRLSRQQSQLLAFIDNFAVPFDNNQTERDIRMVKVQQKVSGGFRSDAGVDAFCRIRGYLSTLRKQGHKILAALGQTLLVSREVPDR